MEINSVLARERKWNEQLEQRSRWNETEQIIKSLNIMLTA